MKIFQRVAFLIVYIPLLSCISATPIEIDGEFQACFADKRILVNDDNTGKYKPLTKNMSNVQATILTKKQIPEELFVSECRVQSITNKKKEWFELLDKKSMPKIEVIHLNRSACFGMVKNQLCNNMPMHCNQSDTYCHYGETYNPNQYVYHSCQIWHGKMKYKSLEKMLADNIYEKCNTTLGYCRFNDSVSVWNTDHLTMCPYERVQDVDDILITYDDINNIDNFTIIASSNKFHFKILNFTFECGFGIFYTNYNVFLSVYNKDNRVTAKRINNLTSRTLNLTRLKFETLRVNLSTEVNNQQMVQLNNTKIMLIQDFLSNTFNVINEAIRNEFIKLNFIGKNNSNIIINFNYFNCYVYPRFRISICLRKQDWSNTRFKMHSNQKYYYKYNN